MKIEGIEVLNLLFRYPDGAGFTYAGGTATGRVTSIVKVQCDTGSIGLGSAYSHPDVVRLIIEQHLAPHLVGSDPEDIDDLWSKMYTLSRWYGRKGAAISALGAIDIALWDLRGKEAGVPLYRLLGGTESRVPAYASGLLWQDSMESLEREAAKHRENGFRAVKMRLGRDPDYDIEALRAVRRGIGKDGRLMVDGSHRYSLEDATWLARILRESDVAWFEEPFEPEDLDSYVALRRLGLVPLAAGENEFGAQGFRELLRAGAVDIVQPDACRTGGVSEWLRIARLAGSSDVRVAPHTWSDAVAVMANAHLVAATAGALTVEVDQTRNGLVEELVTPPLTIRDGMLEIPDLPGLGVELDVGAVECFAVAAGEFIEDGSYSDLAIGARYWSAPARYGKAAR